MESVKTRSNRSIVLGTLLGYLNLFLSIVSGMIFIPWMVKSIGQSNYGLYTLSNSLITLFLFDFGMGATINTFLSKLRAKNDEEGITKFLSITYKIYLLIDVALLVVFTVLFFCIDGMYAGLTPDEKYSLKSIFIVTAIFNLISFPASSFNGVIQAYERFGFLKIIELAQKLLYIGFSLVCLLMNLGLFALVVANCASGFVCIILKLLVLKLNIKTKTNFKIKITKEYLRDVILFSLWSALHAFASRLVFNVMPSILGIVSDSENITLFSIGASLEAYVYTFGAIMNGFFLPKIARIKEQYKNDPAACKKEITHLATIVGRIQLFLISLVLVGFASIGHKFINFWMSESGGDYTVTYIGVMLITLTQLVFIPELIFYTQMFMEKKFIMHLAICSLTKAGLNLALSFVLGKFYGAMGAFISVTIARTFEVVYQNILYKKYLDADLKTFFKKVFLSAIIVIPVSLLFGIYVNNTVMEYTSFGTLIKAVLLITAFFIPVNIAFMNKEQKAALTSIVRRKL